MATHGLASTYKHGCRCKECREANTAYCKAQRAERQTRALGEIPHGLGGYRNWGCRCEVCKTAKSEANAAEQARRVSAA